MFKKYFGQYFLINKNKVKNIVEALELKSRDTVIEIGSGHGELTKAIIERLKNLKIERFEIIAIEKDKTLVDVLRKKFRQDKNIKIIEGDVLKILPKLITQLPNSLTTNCKVVGNIPYYITGYLLRILGELKKKPSLIVLTIQKEVAERIVAQPPKMNLLAASVQFWAKPEIIGYIPKKDFTPQPKIDSAIIKLNYIALHLRSHVKCYANKNEKNYYYLIRKLFKQPRKTILNNLTSNFQFLISKDKIIEKLNKVGINPNDRPQDLSIEQIKQLSTLF